MGVNRFRKSIEEKSMISNCQFKISINEVTVESNASDDDDDTQVSNATMTPDTPSRSPDAVAE